MVRACRVHRRSSSFRRIGCLSALPWSTSQRCRVLSMISLVFPMSSTPSTIALLARRTWRARSWRCLPVIVAKEMTGGGLDHGAWAVLKFLYPQADVPVFQVSIDMSRGLAHQLEIGRILTDLRDRGVLILGSGNIVHNLRAMRPGGQPLAFALEFDALFADLLANRDFAALTRQRRIGRAIRRSTSERGSLPACDDNCRCLGCARRPDIHDRCHRSCVGVDAVLHLSSALRL